MSGKRVFQVTIGIALVLVAVLAAQPFARAGGFSTANEQALHQLRLTERYGESAPAQVSQKALRLDQFSERYGESARPAISPQALRLQQLSERYGDVPASLAQVDAAQAAHESRLTDRYGEALPTPAPDRDYLLGERYGVSP